MWKQSTISIGKPLVLGRQTSGDYKAPKLSGSIKLYRNDILLYWVEEHIQPFVAATVCYILYSFRNLYKDSLMSKEHGVHQPRPTLWSMITLSLLHDNLLIRVHPLSGDVLCRSAGPGNRLNLLYPVLDSCLY